MQGHLVGPGVPSGSIYATEAGFGREAVAEASLAQRDGNYTCAAGAPSTQLSEFWSAAKLPSAGEPPLNLRLERGPGRAPRPPASCPSPVCVCAPRQYVHLAHLRLGQSPACCI